MDSFTLSCLSRVFQAGEIGCVCCMFTSFLMDIHGYMVEEWKLEMFIEMEMEERIVQNISK